MFKAGVAVAMHDLQQLRDLELTMDCPGSSHKFPFSTITSTALRKIIFSATNINHWWVVARRAEDWALLDNQLCGLVNRLRVMGYRHALEAELQFIHVEGNPEACDFTKFLPEFREKGVVTIIDTAHGGRVLHSSIHDR